MQTANCPRCGGLFSLAEEHLGLGVQCPHCQAVVMVPQPTGTPAPSPPIAPSPPAPDMVAPFPPGVPTPLAGATGKATAALVLGIVSIPGCMCYGIPSLVCGVLAIVFGSVAKREIREGRMPASAMGKARAGVICGIVGVVLTACLPLLGLLIAFRGDIGEWVEQMWQQVMVVPGPPP